MDNLIGKTLGNRYEILSQIGEGGMAFVYKAKCHVLNRMVAIKMLKDEFVNDEEFIDKFKNEALSAGGLNQQNIINIYDVSEENGVPYIVMEYVDGGNIKDIIHRQGKIDKDTVLDYSKQIALALKEAHQHKIVHRDIKSQNIMITKNNMVKVADFGIAKAVTSSTITAVGTIMGSVHYFSPEQARGGYIDERSDIYSMGIVMYEMITGRLPFDGDSPVSIALKHIQEEIRFDDNDDIPSEIKDLIRKATQKSPDRRYKTIDDLIDDIEYVKNSKAVALDMGFADETYRTQVISQDDDEYKILFTDLAKEKSAEKSGRKKPKPKPVKEQREVEDESDGKLGKKSYFLIALVALLSSLLFVSAIFLFKNQIGPIGDTTIETPSFEKMTVEQATAEAEKVGLKIVVDGTEVNSKFEPGQITKQNPRKGTKVKEGQEVRVTVSEEKTLEKIKVPNVLQKNVDEAKKMLEESNLKALVEYQSDVAEINTVISQTPEEGYELEEGQRVKIIVSSGIDQSEVTVPQVVGRDLEDAKKALLSSKLKFTISYKEDKNKPEGQILSQSPRANETTTIDSEVSIVVNRYEKPVMSSVPMVVRLDTDRTEVRVEIVDMNTGEVVINQIVNPVEQDGTVAFSVQGKPGETREFNIYLDGDRVNVYASETVTFP